MRDFDLHAIIGVLELLLLPCFRFGIILFKDYESIFFRCFFGERETDCY